jgi:methylmalonyl-CoA mutase cobalamin-binding subunit
MTALSDMGVDVTNPLAIFLALRRLGGPKTEELFATGEPDPSYPRGRRPVVATDMLKDVMHRRAQLLEECLALTDRQRLTSMTAVVASTDIHEFGVFLVKETLAGLGTRVVDGGQSADPEYLAKVALETDADLVAVSTHNGMALSYGKALLSELRRLGARATVAMGGILNEPVDESPTPVDVRDDLERIGVMAIDDIGAMVRALL